jgi:hypothetical protein
VLRQAQHEDFYRDFSRPHPELVEGEAGPKLSPTILGVKSAAGFTIVIARRVGLVRVTG